MTVNYNVNGTRRKAMVQTVSEALGGWEVKYIGAPTFSYRVGDFEIDRNGSLIFDDRTDTKLVEMVLTGLTQAGFACEEQPEIAEAAVAVTEPTADPSDIVNLSISLPREGFTTAVLENLDGILESKGNLIKKAFGIEEASYTLTDDRITFNWFSGEITPDAYRAFADFIGKLCEMAKAQKRVTAKPKTYENEKYAFRCLLLRLGLIGNEYKTSRKILLKNLSGNASWKDGKRKEVRHE